LLLLSVVLLRVLHWLAEDSRAAAVISVSQLLETVSVGRAMQAAAGLHAAGLLVPHLGLLLLHLLVARPAEPRITRV
jgi:hypothetical protein